MLNFRFISGIYFIFKSYAYVAEFKLLSDEDTPRKYSIGIIAGCYSLLIQSITDLISTYYFNYFISPIFPILIFVISCYFLNKRYNRSFFNHAMSSESITKKTKLFNAALSIIFIIFSFMAMYKLGDLVRDIYEPDR